MRLALLLLLASCVDKQEPVSGKKTDQAFVDAHLLRGPVPAAIERVDSSLGGVVTYLGATFDVQQLPPGATVHVHHYWRVDKPIKGAWRVFAQVRGTAGTADFMALPPTDMESWHPVSEWKVGEIIDDPLDFTLRSDWKSQTATLEVGLLAVGQHGIGDRMAASGTRVVDRAIQVKTFAIDLAHAPPPPDTTYVRRAAGEITIDGAANDPGWAGTTYSSEFLQAEGCGESQGKAQAKLAWDDKNLYVFVTVTDPDIVADFTKHDDSLWKQDDIEMFIDADMNKRTYVELQVNPNNATFDSYFSDRQHPDPAWDSHMVTAVQKKVTHQPQGDVTTGWDAEIAIPWDDVKGRDTAPYTLPPVVGARMRLNVVRVDQRHGDKEQAWASSWNRITCSDWHALDRMLTAVFADQGGSIIPAVK